MIRSEQITIKPDLADRLRVYEKETGMPIANIAGEAVRYMLRRLQKGGRWNLVTDYHKETNWKGRSVALKVALSSVDLEHLGVIESIVKNSGEKGLETFDVRSFINCACKAFLDRMDARRAKAAPSELKAMKASEIAPSVVGETYAIQGPGGRTLTVYSDAELERMAAASKAEKAHPWIRFSPPRLAWCDECGAKEIYFGKKYPGAWKGVVERFVAAHCACGKRKCHEHGTEEIK